ncbi:MAG: iron-sulfur cluster assembly scaffold protein [Terriglobales bacterium]|jgi:NifU-like protein involved in Fe-S cluster formation
MFSKAVLDHFRNPRNAGDLAGATAIVEVSNPACGDVLRLAARVENGRILETRFLCRGCATSIACASFLTEQVSGRTLAEAQSLTQNTLSEALGGLPAATLHGAQLATEALAALLSKLLPSTH